MKNNLQQSTLDSQLGSSVPSGYKQTEVGVIPEDWEVKRLGDVLTVRHGRSQHDVAVSDGRYPIFASGGEIGRTNTSLYDKPSVLIGRKGTIDKPRFAETPFWTVDTLFYTEILRQNSAKFIFYRFCMIPWKNYNEASGVPSLNTKTIENIEIALPQPSEQVAIAKALSDMDALLEGLDRLIAKKRDLKQATMQALLTPPAKRVESGKWKVESGELKVESGKWKVESGELKVESGKWKVESGKLKVESCDSANSQLSTLNSPLKNVRLPGFEGEWEVKRLEEITDIRSGGTPSTSNPNFWDGGVPWCTPTDITALRGRKHLRETAKTISVSGLRASSAETVPIHSVIMTSRATIGECAINIVPMTTNQGFKNLIPRDINFEFLYYLMTTQKERLIQLCGGSTFLEIGKRQLSQLEVAIPPTKEEQTAIAAVLSDMDAEIKALEQRRDKTADLKQGMMQELLTGRIRIT